MTVELLEAPEVAKAKHGGKRPGSGRPTEAGTTKEHILGMRGTPEYGQWVRELAEHCRLSLADTVDQALVELARDRGFPKAPPKR